MTLFQRPSALTRNLSPLDHGLQGQSGPVGSSILPELVLLATDDPGCIRIMAICDFVAAQDRLRRHPQFGAAHAMIRLTAGQIRLVSLRDHVLSAAEDFCYMPARTAFVVNASEDARGYVALIPTALTSVTTPHFPETALTASLGDHASPFETTLVQLASEPQADADTTACLMNLLALRLRQLGFDLLPKQQIDKPMDGTVVDRFRTMVRQRLGTCWSVADLAAEMGCTTAVLDHACHAALGKRAVDVVHDIQVDCALSLLRDTRQPTQTIALRLGYSSHTHFVRAFMEATGRTPEAYRAQPG